MIEEALADLRSKFQAAFGVFVGDSLRTSATPRRLVLRVEGLAPQAPDTQVLVQGPYLSAGPKAAEGFARKQGTTVEALAKITDSKGERCVFHQHIKGQKVDEALREKLPELIRNIHFPKSMQWTGKGGVRFIRPIRWIVALLDKAVVDFEIAGIRSGNMTRGHRILGAKGPIPVTTQNYEGQLRDNYVLVKEQEREARIQSGLVDGAE